MATEYTAFAGEIIKNDSISDAEKRGLLKDFIDKLLDAGKYREASDVVSETVFSEDTYVFEHIIDEWLRYDQLFLEALTCEMNYVKGALPSESLRVRSHFKRVVAETKFAVREVWFGLPEAAKSLISVRGRYRLSAHFLAVVCKAAVPQELVAAVLLGMAAVIKAVSRKDSDMLKAYADFFDSVNGNGKRFKPAKLLWPDPAAATQEGQDSKKVAYIACVNDDIYADEAARYIMRQRLPEGFSVETVFVRDASSMAAGYNRGMRSTNAKYKVYIHQDIFVCDPDFTIRMIQAFEDTGADMLGIAGTKKLPHSGVWWDAEGDDRQLCLWQDWILSTAGACNGTAGVPMEALDGVLIATIRDVPWREDVLQHFHFYDISQCLEFRRRGYKIHFFDNDGVPGVLHEVSVNHSEEYSAVYEAERRKFAAEYEEDLKCI